MLPGANGIFSLLNVNSSGKGEKMIVAYDYDGVLVDSLDANIDMMNQILVSMGKKALVTRAMFQKLKVISFEAIGEIVQLSSSEMSTFLAIIANNNLAIQHKTFLFNGVVEHLQKVSAKAQVYIVSNNDSDLVHQVMDKAGLTSYITGVHGPEEGLSKSERLEKIIRNTGDKDLYFIGDGVSDITEGNNAGCMTVAVSWGFQSLKVLEPYNPIFCVSSFSELEKVLTL